VLNQCSEKKEQMFFPRKRPFSRIIPFLVLMIISVSHIRTVFIYFYHVLLLTRFLCLLSFLINPQLLCSYKPRRFLNLHISTLKMEAASFSKKTISAFITTRCDNTENHIVTITAWKPRNIVTNMTIARQLFGKHISEITQSAAVASR
jgi:hypothetical protein